MKFNRLGASDMVVSDVCLGTTTWGVQNTEEEAHEQLDYTLSRGINFIDTAEMYPAAGFEDGVPGTSELYLGSYLRKHPGLREKLIIATKVLGYAKDSVVVAQRYDPPLTERPFPDARLDAESIKHACAVSLKRMNTDYIDLYQLHWPDRYVPIFGERGYNPDNDRDEVPIKDTLLALKDLLDEGKIKAYGLSNETAYGVAEFVRLADLLEMPRPVTIQNSFCLVDRQFETDLAEMCAPRNYNIGLLPWSILAGGTLSGKYNKELLYPDDPKRAFEGLEDCRHVKFPDCQARFKYRPVLEAVEKYKKVAADAGISVAMLAQAFCKTRWYIPSSIIGATKMSHLKENIDAFEVELDEKTVREIDRIHNENKDIVLSS